MPSGYKGLSSFTEFRNIESFFKADQDEANEFARIAQKEHPNPSYIRAWIIPPVGEYDLIDYGLRTAKRLIWTSLDNGYPLTEQGLNPRKIQIFNWHNNGAAKERRNLRELSNHRIYGI
jgi:hypothetical protein